MADPRPYEERPKWVPRPEPKEGDPPITYPPTAPRGGQQ
jgi:hypothetical protein